MATESPAGKARSKLEKVVSPALDKVIKNSAWRKHSKLAQEAKAAIEKLGANSLEAAATAFESPLYEDNSLCYSAANAELILQPLIGACETAYPKVVEPALDCLQKLIAHGHLRGEMDTLTPDNKLLLEVRFPSPFLQQVELCSLRIGSLLGRLCCAVRFNAGIEIKSLCPCKIIPILICRKF